MPNKYTAGANFRILSMDVSASSTGWSFLDGVDGKIEYGTIKTKSNKSTAERLTNFRSELRVILDKHKPSVVVLEDTFIGKNPSVNKLLSKFGGVAEQTVFEYCSNVPYIVSNKSVKAFFKAKCKEDMFAIVVDVLEWDVRSHPFNKFNDIVDSIGQLMYCCDSTLGIKQFRLECDYGYRYQR